MQPILGVVEFILELTLHKLYKIYILRKKLTCNVEDMLYKEICFRITMDALLMEGQLLNLTVLIVHIRLEIMMMLHSRFKVIHKLR